jgi:WD40 repeat protein
MRSKMSSNPRRPHFSGRVALLLTGLAGLGLGASVGCTRSLYVGSSTTSDLNPGQPDSGSTGGATGTGGSPPTCNAPGTGGSAVTTSCATISTTPGVVNACGRTTGIAYSPDGQLLATATETPNPSIHIWRLSDGSLVRNIAGHGRYGSYSVAFSPDGSILATAGNAPVVDNCGVTTGPALTDNDPTVVKLWDVATGNLLREIPAACGSYADAATFSHDGARLVTAGYDNAIQVWNVADGSLVTTIPVTTTFYNAHFSPDDTRVIGAGMGTGGVWNAATGALIFAIPGLEDEMNDAAYSPDGSRIVTTGNQGNLQVFDANGALLQSIPTQAQSYFSHVVWVDDTHVVNDDWGGDIQSWTPNAGGSFVASGSWSLGMQALGLAVSPDRAHLAVGGGSGFMFISYQPVAPAVVHVN